MLHAHAAVAPLRNNALAGPAFQSTRGPLDSELAQAKVITEESPIVKHTMHDVANTTKAEENHLVPDPSTDDAQGDARQPNDDGFRDSIASQIRQVDQDAEILASRLSMLLSQTATAESTLAVAWADLASQLGLVELRASTERMLSEISVEVSH